VKCCRVPSVSRHHSFLQLESIGDENSFGERCFPARSVSALLCWWPAALVPGVTLGPQTETVFSHWRRVSETPVLSPTGAGWESVGTFNLAVLVRDNKFVMLFRAQDAAGTSRLGCAESTDGVHFTRKYGAVFSPEADYEKGRRLGRSTSATT